MKKTLLCVTALLFANYACMAKSYLVSTPYEFNTAAGKAAPGDEIVIKDGTYTNWNVTAATSGNAGKPIIIKPQHTGKAIFTGATSEPLFKITGNYIQLNNLTFNTCELNRANGKTGMLILLENTTYTQINNCTFEKNSGKTQFMPLIIIGGNGEYNQVQGCSFSNTKDAMDVQVRVTQGDCPQYTLISKNVFKDKAVVSWPNINGGECVQVGQDPVLQGNVKAHTTVRNNRFINCNAEPEVVSNKSSGNKYIANYFENCEGELVMRGGHDCLVDSNVFKGGLGGIRICGTGHTVTHNNISNVKTGIRLYYGMAAGKNEVGFYIAASNCAITNNIISNVQTAILVGDSKNMDWAGKFDTKRYPSQTMQNVAPANNIIKDNSFNKAIQTVVYQ